MSEEARGVVHERDTEVGGASSWKFIVAVARREACVQWASSAVAPRPLLQCAGLHDDLIPSSSPSS